MKHPQRVVASHFSWLILGFPNTTEKAQELHWMVLISVFICPGRISTSDGSKSNNVRTGSSSWFARTSHVWSFGVSKLRVEQDLNFRSLRHRVRQTTRKKEYFLIEEREKSPCFHPCKRKGDIYKRREVVQKGPFTDGSNKNKVHHAIQKWKSFRAKNR